jgi:hypothetical protein
MMKRQLVLLTVFALAAGPAFAQSSFGTAKPRGGYQAGPPLVAPPLGAPAPPRAPTVPATPSPGGFKPYEPYKGSSVYSAPKPASSGAKPCETSVYVNACGKR